MLNTTAEAVRSILRADPSLTPADRSWILASIRNHGKEPEREKAAPAEPRILRRREVADRLAISLRAVDTWAKDGIIHKLKLPGRIRACGFRSQEIDALVSGG